MIGAPQYTRTGSDEFDVWRKASGEGAWVEIIAEGQALRLPLVISAAAGEQPVPIGAGAATA